MGSKEGWRTGTAIQRFFITFLLLLSSVWVHGQTLPADAQVGVWRLPASGWLSEKTQQSGEFVSRLKGDTKDYRLVFYSVPNPLVSGCDGCRAYIVSVTDGEGNVVFEFCPGNRIESESDDLVRETTLDTSFFEPSGVQILGVRQLPTIVSFTLVGNAGFFLDLFRWDGQTFRHVNGDWHRTVQVDGVEFRDLDGDGIDEIVILHKRRRSVDQWGHQTVYRWNGEVYERAEKSR